MIKLKFAPKMYGISSTLWDTNKKVLYEWKGTCRETFIHSMWRPLALLNIIEHNRFINNFLEGTKNKLIFKNDELIKKYQDYQICFRYNKGLPATVINESFLQAVMQMTIEIANPEHKEIKFNIKKFNNYWGMYMFVKYFIHPIKISLIIGIFRQALSAIEYNNETIIKAATNEINLLKTRKDKVNFLVDVFGKESGSDFYAINFEEISSAVFKEQLNVGTIFGNTAHYQGNMEIGYDCKESAIYKDGIISLLYEKK